MFKNYFKTTFRNFARNKVYSFINIAGLSMGIACAMLIMLYVNDEVSFDRFNKNATNIYRIVTGSDAEHKMSVTKPSEGPLFIQNVSGLKYFVRLRNGAEDMKNGNEVQSQDVLYVDSSFFSVFTFPLLSGNPKTCLTEPHSVVLSEDAAKKQFGTTDAVGKIVMIKDDSIMVPYKVTAVAKRCPQNSSIQFDVLLQINITDAEANNNTPSLMTFVMFDNKANPKTVKKQMKILYEANTKQALNEARKNGDAHFQMSSLFLQPYLDIHLSKDLPANRGLTNASDPVYSYILSGIALFVLLIACINSVNLTVAHSIKRAKEIGIRKIAGSNRKQLILQFLGESFLICTIAFLLAIMIAQFLLPLFNNVANKALSLSYLFNVKLIAAYIVLYIVTGLLAGFYPALILSGYNPAQTLYGRFQIAGKNYLQKSLIVLQFTLASFLIIATFIIYAQFNFLTKTNIGYDDNNLITIETSDTKQEKAAAFKSELMKNPDIIGVSAKFDGVTTAFTGDAVNPTVFFQSEKIDEGYLPLLKIPVIAGRNFSSAFPSDSAQSVIVNESFVKAAHWKNPVGELVNFDWDNNKKYRVIGVVKDYHFASLNEKIIPQLFTSSDLYGMYWIKIKPNSAAESLKWIKNAFQQFYPLDPYSYMFKNDENKRQYAAIEKWKQIMLFSALLTIFISCIGLFGLSVLSAEKRTKEIGIRKVLGASVQQIVTTLSADFIKLVGLAFIIASPLVYIAANKWLQNYPYRITINWRLFALAALLVVFIALLTISFQSIKAAITNPVKSLRTE